MNAGTWTRLTWLAMGAVLLSAPCAVRARPPFSDVALATAIERAEKQGRLLILDFTAAWCEPCNRMEATSWPDEGVAAWIATHAIAVQIDVDEHADLAERYSVGSLPCVVAIRRGVEVDRVMGYSPPTNLLAWLNGLAAGRTHAQDVLERASALVGSSDIEARYELANDLVETGQVALARREYTWVWERTRGNDDWGGVRHSFLVSAMRQLAEASPELLKDMTEWRDQARRHVEGDGGTDPIWWNEWVALAWKTDELDDVVSWFEAECRARERLSGSPPAFAPHVIAGVFDLLLEARRFAEAAALYPDAVSRAKELLGALELAGELERDPTVDSDLRKDALRRVGAVRARMVADLVRALLAVHRDDEAEVVADMVLRRVDYPSTREALIRAAIDSKRRDFPALRLWLRELDEGGVDTRRLRRALRGKGRGH
ncbi:MAG: thioredoxin family protein [Myxococcales bacterium]|nr:thioredoxin family protein [Myxococcales bacterium]